MLDNLKKYWFLYGVVIGFATWLITINSRIFDSPEQKVKHETHVNNAISPIQQQRAYLMDSLDKDSAIKKRALTLERDSLERARTRKNDSIILDYIQKNADQIFQIRQEHKKHE